MVEYLHPRASWFIILGPFVSGVAHFLPFDSLVLGTHYNFWLVRFLGWGSLDFSISGFWQFWMGAQATNGWCSWGTAGRHFLDSAHEQDEQEPI